MAMRSLKNCFTGNNSNGTKLLMDKLTVIDRGVTRAPLEYPYHIPDLPPNSTSIRFVGYNPSDFTIPNPKLLVVPICARFQRLRVNPAVPTWVIPPPPDQWMKTIRIMLSHGQVDNVTLEANCYVQDLSEEIISERVYTVRYHFVSDAVLLRVFSHHTNTDTLRNMYSTLFSLILTTNPAGQHGNQIGHEPASSVTIEVQSESKSSVEDEAQGGERKHASDEKRDSGTGKDEKVMEGEKDTKEDRGEKQRKKAIEKKGKEEGTHLRTDKSEKEKPHQRKRVRDSSEEREDVKKARRKGRGKKRNNPPSYIS